MDLSATSTTAGHHPPSSAAPPKTYFFKCVLVGNPAVGKTCLVNRLANGKFIDSPITTFSAAFVQLSVPLRSRGDGGGGGGGASLATVDLWDTAGQERYRSLTLSYFRDARAVLVAYDEENASSLGDWLKELRRFLGGEPGGAGRGVSDALVFLVGTKLDLGPGVALSEGQVRQLSARHEIDIAGHFALSAKTGAGLTEALQVLAETVVSAGELGRLDLTPRAGTLRLGPGSGSRSWSGAKKGGDSSGWCC